MCVGEIETDEYLNDFFINLEKRKVFVTSNVCMYNLDTFNETVYRSFSPIHESIYFCMINISKKTR